MNYYKWVWKHRIGVTEVRDKITDELIFSGRDMLLVSKAGELLDEYKSKYPESSLFQGEE